MMDRIRSAGKNIPDLQPRSAVAVGMIGLLAVAFIALPAYLLLWGVYSWHLKQPETVQGGIELLAVFVILALSAAMTRIPRLFSSVIIGVSVLYLQLHSVLLSAAAAWLFLEALIRIGSAIHRLTSLSCETDLVSYLKRFLVGVASWTLGALVISAFGMGTIPHLRIYTIALAAVAAVIAPVRPLGVIMVQRLEQVDLHDRLFVVFLIVLILTQFGKANYGNDYDSMWYGLRPERVLVGPRSIFDSLKLLHYVYYYPKQFEFLTLPLAGLNHGTFIIPFNVVLLVLSFFAIFLTTRELGINRTGALLVTALTGTIPAVSNMASTAKTDTLFSLYAFSAALFLWRWCKERVSSHLCYGLTAILGMAGTKISAYAYSPLLLLGFMATGFWMHYSVRQSGSATSDASGLRKWQSHPAVIPIIAAFACMGLMLRTWILTGTPTLPAFVEYWKWVGISPRYPWSLSGFEFTGVPVEGAREFIVYWFRLLFDPKLYSHYVMAWPGNAAFFFVCAFVILAIVRSVRPGFQGAFFISCLPLIAGGILTACLVRTPNQGWTDGNYYTVPVVLTIVAVAGILASVHGRVRWTMAACSFGFIMLQLPVMFVSHWSWHSGTQPFHFVFNRTLFDRRSEIESGLKNAGVWELEEYLRRKPHRTGLCVGFSKGQESTLHMLSCVHEDLEQSAPVFWQIFESKSRIRQYLTWAQPDIFMIPKSLSYGPSGPGTPIREVFEELARDKNVVRVEAKEFVALDLSSRR